MSRASRHRGVVLAGYLLILLDVSILMAALPTIHRDLGFSPTTLSWAQNAYTLTFGGLLLLGARAGDLLGRRRTFMLVAPRVLAASERHAARLDVTGAVCSTLGAGALVFGIVHSADAGWTAGSTVAALAAGVVLLALFVDNQARGEQPLMPLRLFADRGRVGAYAARFLFNAVLVSFFLFMTQYLQGVAGLGPLQAGLAFLPVTGAAFAAAAITSRTAGRVSNDALAIGGCAAMLVGTAWMSRVSIDTGYVLGIAVPMVVFGVGQGLGLSSLTTGGMAGVQPRDAAVAGGLVNVAHHLGGALGLGILVTVFDAAGARGDGPQALLAGRVSAALTVGCLFLVLALAVTVATRNPHPHRAAAPGARPSRATA